MRRLLALLLPVLLLDASPPPPVLDAAALEALRSVDLRLAMVMTRLTVGNAALCAETQPVPGWALHAIDQYAPDERPLARRVFGFAAPVAVEAVVPDGAAARAGIGANDAVLAIGGIALPTEPTTAASIVARDAAQALLARQPAGPVAVTVLREGARRTVAVAAPRGCRVASEVVLGPAMVADSDGAVVRIGVRFFERYDEEAIAAIAAHELAHVVLWHRARLEAAGVRWGLLAEVGRNGRLFRRTEEEADRLSVWLLRGAGYDPAIAARFWRDHGGEVDGGLFRSRTHPAASVRARLIAAEAAAMAGTPPGTAPPLVATRDVPLE